MRHLAATLALALMTTTAQAHETEFKNGFELKAMCLDGPFSNVPGCVGYIMAVYDTIKLAEDLDRSISNEHCQLEDRPSPKVVETVIGWLREQGNEDRLKQNAAAVVRRALLTNFTGLNCL